MSTDDADRWDARYAEDDPPSHPAASVVELAKGLTPGRALDVAGGAGRHAIWLAECGWRVTLVDASEVALRIAGQRGRDAGVFLRLLRRDMDTDLLPPGPFDLVVVVAYLDHEVLERIPTVLGRHGRLLFVHPTVTNLQRHDRPSRQFLLEPGEMAALAERLGLEIEVCQEGWSADDRHEARLLARRTA